MIECTFKDLEIGDIFTSRSQSDSGVIVAVYEKINDTELTVVYSPTGAMTVGRIMYTNPLFHVAKLVI